MRPQMVYAHRAGRTGRMGAPGVVVSLVGKHEVQYLQRMCKKLGVKLQVRLVGQSHTPLDLQVFWDHENFQSPRIGAGGDRGVIREQIAAHPLNTPRTCCQQSSTRPRPRLTGG